MSTPLVDYYRCPSQFGEFGLSGDLSPGEGYFTFRESTCYGRCRGGTPSKYTTDNLPDVSRDVECANGDVGLPFDLSEVVTNLQQERYCQTEDFEKVVPPGAVRGAYYLLRPMLPIALRKHLQKLRLRRWRQIAFPSWPVDFTVDTLMRTALTLALQSARIKRIPFIWFWPNGASSCAIMTHDVEEAAGRDFCSHLIDIDESYGFKSAFQIVPEGRYERAQALAATARSRGCEVNVHDLNHDGRLFDSREHFQRRAAQINEYGREFQSRGFRSGCMYREQRWYDAFEFSYDMSVPNVAHLEPQQGGCCTVMPYFIDKIVELPLTTIQDYSLFHILGDYSIALWKKQIDLIVARNGLVSLLSHPDYLIEKRAQVVYRDLLEHLRHRRDQKNIWFALPGEVDRWWRNRNMMALVRHGESWRIEGADSDRARVAYASLESDRLVYDVESPS